MTGQTLRVVIAAAASAVVLMMWGFVFWTVLPFSMMFIETLPNEEAVASAIRDSGTASGVYTYPGPDGMDPDDEEGLAAWKEKHRRGPVLHVFVTSRGIEPMAPELFVQGMLHSFVSSLLAAGLLSVVVGSLKGYAQRVAFVTGLGVFAGVAVRLSDAIWFYHAWGYQIMVASYVVSSWILAGFVLAAIIRPKAA